MITAIKPNSKMLNKIEYDDETNILTVTFNNDSKYEYYNVTTEEWRELLESTSIGSTFSKKIKPNHKYEKIG